MDCHKLCFQCAIVAGGVFLAQLPATLTNEEKQNAYFKID